MKKAFQFMVLTFSASVIVWASGCAPAAAPTPEPSQVEPLLSEPVSTDAVAGVEEQAGFDILEPGYLPAGVSLESATFEAASPPSAVLQFKLVHEQYGDMGSFFSIRQELHTEEPAGALSCGESVEGCEVLRVGDMPVVYHLYASPAGDGADTESFEWYADGFFFRLHRTAGEPGKTYQEELLNVVRSMQ